LLINKLKHYSELIIKKSSLASSIKHFRSKFIHFSFSGGADDTIKAAHSGKLAGMLTQTPAEKHDYDYDVVIIGGGSGGLAASKEAARLNRKVAVCDFVKPSPPGTTWGLGGTCVNVGCIPKKLMHQASLIGEYRKDGEAFGFPAAPDGQDWAKIVENIQNHIGGLNWGYKVELRDKKVKYLNEYATFVDNHTIKTVNKKGKEGKVTSKYFIIAVGGRPRYPDIPGAKEYGVTSDDIFSLSYNPGKTLLVGASYISLESAGFLHGMGLDVTVMVRSILLRGFDQQCANKIGDYMEGHLGINFVRGCVPLSLEKMEDGAPGKVKVKGKYTDGTEYEDWFNTVIFAVGRDSEAPKLNLEGAGVKYEKNGKIKVDERERTNQENIYAVGDVLDGQPELTPLAIQSGMLLSRRLAKVSEELTDYDNVPTTVFTPLEYGCVGLSEEDAIKKYGEEDLEVYHKNFWPLEWTLPKRPDNACYAKMICVKSQQERVVGLHYLGPNAGEVTQGFAGMLAMNAKKSDFDRMVGIHPTTAETFTTLTITKGSGVDPAAAGC